MSYDPIPPQVRSRLKNLRLTARRAAGSQGIGLHHSRSRGAGLEFAQYRAYEPGDELRQIDWKLYGRSDRFFVRESERESPIAAWMLIDASASMAQEDAARPGWSRLGAAKALAACIGEMAMRQGDRFGWVVLRDDGLRVATPNVGVRQRDRMLLELHALTAQGAFPALDQLAPIWDRVGAQDLVILLSDCFDDAAIELIERLAAARREVLAIEMLTAEERDFPFHGGYRFRDPETGEELLGDGIAMRAEFLARFAEARAALHARLD
ncbi:MAG: von Willebrand factor type domain protein, partial [Rhizorhabdus sp.]|nr:von Willebrand factor type domain protein [Rhizorhabdus sp.]